MGKTFVVILTALVTATFTSAFWIFAYSLRAQAGGSDGQVESSGDVQVVRGTRPGSSVAMAEGVEVGPAALVVPVAGIKVSQLIDTFTQARAGGRQHDAIDIMAPAGTPVVAAQEGRVEKLFYSNGGGGITVYVRSSDGRWTHYYAHLRGYAPDLREGMEVKRGQVIGFVGSTGNASPGGPHLHFAINQMQAGESWWQGSPINPYPMLAGKRV